VSLSSPPPSRAHLRLASPAADRPSADGRLVLRVRAIGAALALVLATVAAWLSTALALAPLLCRRGPAGRRLRAQAPREARVIPFQPRRTALPR
jgi:hypothetical protein